MFAWPKDFDLCRQNPLALDRMQSKWFLSPVLQRLESVRWWDGDVQAMVCTFETGTPGIDAHMLSHRFPRRLWSFGSMLAVPAAESDHFLLHGANKNKVWKGLERCHNSQEHFPCISDNFLVAVGLLWKLIFGHDGPIPFSYLLHRDEIQSLPSIERISLSYDTSLRTHRLVPLTMPWIKPC